MTHLFILALMLALYFMPTIVACLRGHTNKAPVIALNIFLGWTLIGWVVAFCWSLTAQTKAVIVQ